MWVIIGIIMIMGSTFMTRRRNKLEAAWWFFGALGYGVIGIVCALTPGATLAAIPLGWCAGWYTYIAAQKARTQLDY